MNKKQTLKTLLKEKRYAPSPSPNKERHKLPTSISEKSKGCESHSERHAPQSDNSTAHHSTVIDEIT